MSEGKHEPSAEFRQLFKANVEMPDLGEEAVEYFNSRPEDMAMFEFIGQMFQAEMRGVFRSGRPFNLDAVCASAALGLRELGFHR